VYSDSRPTPDIRLKSKDLPHNFTYQLIYTKMDLQEVGGGCGDWMELAQDRERWRAVVSAVMNFQVP
jgi:hypothetical protein